MTTAVILAAGGATRFGGPKQLAEIGGVSLVRRAVLTARESDVVRIVCVVGAHRHAVAEAISDLEVHIIANEDWASGLSTSISRGVSAAIQLGEAEALAILLSDQPLIPASHIRSLFTKRAASRAPIAATTYEQGDGVPAVFSSSMFQGLQTLSGDRGASALIRSCEERVSVSLPTLASVDVDSPEDLEVIAAVLQSK